MGQMPRFTERISSLIKQRHCTEINLIGTIQTIQHVKTQTLQFMTEKIIFKGKRN